MQPGWHHGLLRKYDETLQPLGKKLCGWSLFTYYTWSCYWRLNILVWSWFLNFRFQTQKNNPKTKCFFSLSKEKIPCQEQQEKDRAGCSPKVAPTEGWIDSQRSRYVLPNFDAPLQSGAKLRFCYVKKGSESGFFLCFFCSTKRKNGWLGYVYIYICTGLYQSNSIHTNVRDCKRCFCYRVYLQ